MSITKNPVRMNNSATVGTARTLTIPLRCVYAERAVWMDVCNVDRLYIILITTMTMPKRGPTRRDNPENKPLIPSRIYNTKTKKRYAPFRNVVGVYQFTVDFR